MPGSNEEISCTVCRKLIPSSNGTFSENIFAHPVLKVILCKLCYTNISNTNSSDDNKSCLWCGSLGISATCIKCTSHFCKECLRNNFKEDEFYNIIKKKKWICFKCSPSPIFEHRTRCDTIMKKIDDIRTLTVPKKRKRSSSESFERVKKRTQRSQSFDELIYDGDIEDFSDSCVKNKPTRQDFDKLKNEVIDRLSDVYTSLFKSIFRFIEFEKKFTSQDSTVKVMQKGVTFNINLSDKVADVMTKWKNDLKEIDQQWKNKFGIALFVVEPEPKEDNGQNKSTNCSENRNPSFLENLNTPIKKKKFNLSLKKTNNTELTDDDAKSNAISEEIEEASIAQAHNSNCDTDDSIFSESTVIIGKNDIDTEPDFRESNRTILCEITGNLITNDVTSNTAISSNIPDNEQSDRITDTSSEKSFVFNLSNYNSVPVQDESYDSDKTEIIDNDDNILSPQKKNDFDCNIQTETSLEKDGTKKTSIDINKQEGCLQSTTTINNNSDIVEIHSTSSENDHASLESNDCNGDVQNQIVDPSRSNNVLQDTNDCVSDKQNQNANDVAMLEISECIIRSQDSDMDCTTLKIDDSNKNTTDQNVGKTADVETLETNRNITDANIDNNVNRENLKISECTDKNDDQNSNATNGNENLDNDETSEMNKCIDTEEDKKAGSEISNAVTDEHDKNLKTNINETKENECINNNEQNIVTEEDNLMSQSTVCISNSPQDNNLDIDVTNATFEINNSLNNLNDINSETDDGIIETCANDVQNQKEAITAEISNQKDHEHDVGSSEQNTNNNTEIIVLDDISNDAPDENAKIKYLENLGLTAISNTDLTVKLEDKVQDIEIEIRNETENGINLVNEKIDGTISKKYEDAVRFLQEDVSWLSNSSSTSDASDSDEDTDDSEKITLETKTKSKIVSKSAISDDCDNNSRSNNEESDSEINGDNLSKDNLNADAENEKNKQSQIKPCSVVLKNINDTVPVALPSNVSPSSEVDDEMRCIERLTNLNNLNQKRKTATDSPPPSKSKKLKRQKTSKSTCSSSSDSDTDTDSEEGSVDNLLKTLQELADKNTTPLDNVPPRSTPSDPTTDLLEAILASDDGLSDDENDGTDGNHSSDERKKKDKGKRASSSESNKENHSDNKETSKTDSKQLTAEDKQKAEKKKWRNDYLLHERFTESEKRVDQKDNEESDQFIDGDSILSEKTKKKIEELERKKELRTIEKENQPSSPKLKSDNESDANTKSDNEAGETDRIIINTDSDSDIEFISESKKRPFPRPKKSLFKDGLVCISSSEDDEEETDDDEGDESGKKKGRRNIRAILSDETLEESTKKANYLEERRKSRLSKKHKDMNEFLSQSQIPVDEMIILDIDKKTEKPLVAVDPVLTRRLKKHQREGVRFMWESCYESIDQIEKDPGSGCILAHCMGLGKTFQVVALIHTLFSHSKTKTKHVMVICPLSIVLNWKNEFIKGLEGVRNKDEINIHCISDRLSGAINRLYFVDKWRQDGGVLIMGYEAYHCLTKAKDPEKLTRQEKNIKKILINPGPDLVVLDEGHLLKNGKTRLTKALMKVKTRRRIILTGTPLQNNLREYYYMVQFVKPNLLGSYREYANRFVNPIINGQFHDSTEKDIHDMKKRTHVLHKLLEAAIQRYEVSELCPYLPNKYDYVLFIKLHPVQASLCEKQIEILKDGTEIVKGNVIVNYHKLHLLWTHPLLLQLKDEQKKNPQKRKEMDVVNLDPEIDEPDESPDGWWQPICPNDFKTNIDYGPKFKIMLSIIRECEAYQDKVLIFSNSILELDAIEVFLQLHSTAENQWVPKLDYYRLDGAVAPEKRLKMCNKFNDESNKRARLFLISHRVGGLGLNLVAANRVIVMDVSWNPAYDVQSIFRIYRFGQKKQCYIYRLVAMGTMEEIVYQRTIHKLAIAGRVVDKMQMPRHYNSDDLQMMYKLNLQMDQERLPQISPIDDVLKCVLQSCEEVFKYHEHQNLLLDDPAEQLNENDRLTAWQEYNAEKNDTKEREQMELAKRRVLALALQSGTSGVNNFLPNPMSRININNSAPGVRPLSLRRNSVVQKLLEQSRFETVFLPNANRQDYMEDSAHRKLLLSQSNKQQELKKKYFDFIRQNSLNSPTTNQSNTSAQNNATVTSLTQVNDKTNNVFTKRTGNSNLTLFEKNNSSSATSLTKVNNKTKNVSTERSDINLTLFGKNNVSSFNINEQQNIIACLNENLDASLSHCDRINDDTNLDIYKNFVETPTMTSQQQAAVAIEPVPHDVILIE